jgi:hypothetical protein
VKSFDKITVKDIEKAMAKLSTLKFFPANPAAAAEIQIALMRKVPHRQALEFLVEQFVDRIGEWHGPAELWGVLETRYNALNRPVEGHWSKLPGYTASDGEARFLAIPPPYAEPLSLASRKMLEAFDVPPQRAVRR